MPLAMTASTCSNGCPEPLDVLGRDAGAVVLDVEIDLVGDRLGANLDRAAFGRELDRIAHERGQNALDRRRVRLDGDFRLDRDRDRDPLLPRRRRDIVHRAADRFVGAKPAVAQPLAPGLEPGHVQNVADHVQQVFAARQDVLAIVAVFFRSERAEGLVAHQLREADDRIERRAQLVAHVGEKIGLGAIGRFGLRLLLVVALGEIDQLLGLLLERASGLTQLGDGREQQALGVHQLLFMLLERGDVGSDRHEPAVAGPAFVDLQPSPVRQARLVGARLAPRQERLAGFLRHDAAAVRAGGADASPGEIMEALVLRVAEHELDGWSPTARRPRRSPRPRRGDAGRRWPTLPPPACAR